MPIWKGRRAGQRDSSAHLCLWRDEQGASPRPALWGEQTSHIGPFCVTGICSAGAARGWESASVSASCVLGIAAVKQSRAHFPMHLKYSPECSFCHEEIFPKQTPYPHFPSDNHLLVLVVSQHPSSLPYEGKLRL